MFNLCLEKLTSLLFLSPSNSHRNPPRDHRVQGSPQGSDLIVFAVVTVTSSWFPFPRKAKHLHGSSFLPLAQEAAGEIHS